MSDLIIDGEEISRSEEADLRRMIEHDTKECAALFFEQEPDRLGQGGRSKKFRRSWNKIGKFYGKDPCEYFVNLKWKHFFYRTRAWYAFRMTTEPEEVALRLRKAVLIMAQLSESTEATDVLQLMPDTKAFDGDAFENRSVTETYGDHADAIEKTALGLNSIH